MSNAPTASPLLVRIPLPLKQWLADRAKTNNRTMNGEILTLIKSEQVRLQKVGA